MESLVVLLTIIALIASGVLVWVLCKLYSNARYSTKRVIKVCFWGLLILAIICFSPYLDFERAFQRSFRGGVSALIIMGIYFGIKALIDKFGKK